ncbi:MAG TPA: LPS export ABC transporter ATP-binding protein [Nitrospiria bacterium]|nr:LPS export ABC transporter ATP-binding protein [Nitrospiria bacterium]
MALEAKGLSKWFRRRHVVRSVDVELKGGEIVGLLGPNGAGKTTIFSMIVGLITPSDGRVLLDGVDITLQPIHRRARAGLGYLPQEPSVFQKLTVEENLTAVLEVMGMDRAARRDKAAAVLHEFGLARVSGQRAYTLSGGERRRLEIARAMLTEPRYLLLDEPFSGIDPIVVGELQRLLLNICRGGLGILVTDHNVQETLRVTNRAYLIYDGRVLHAGTPEQLAADPKVRAVYLGERFQFQGRPLDGRSGGG